MNEMKEEAQKKRALEARHSKDAAKHKKEQRLMEVKMKKLEADKRQKDLVLRRKMEEVSKNYKFRALLSASVSAKIIIW